MSMRIVALAGTVTALLAAGPQQQPADGVSWAGSWEEAVAEATERNVPILYSVQQDENPTCQQMQGAFRDGSFIRESRRVVCVVSNPDTKHGIREQMVAGKKTPFCKAYDNMNCDVHVRCQSVIGKFVDTKSGSFDIPMQVWTRPDGKELFKGPTGANGAGGQSAAALIKDLERALERVSGPKLGRTEWVGLKKLIRDGEEAQGRNDFKYALKCFKSVMECKHDKFAEIGKSKYEGYIAQCCNLVTRALKQYHSSEKDSPKQKEVKPLLQKIAKEMKGTEAGTAAEDALKQIK